jgi:hypothetical protein
MGKPEEARLLYIEEQLQVSKEAMRANRETLGDRHTQTRWTRFMTRAICCATWVSWRRRGRCSRRRCRGRGRRWATATRTR